MKSSVAHCYGLFGLAENLFEKKSEDGTMVKRFSRRWWINAVPAIFLMITLSGLASVYSSTDNETHRPDIIFIDLPSIFGGDKMPAVPFFHDKHTEALGEGQDCSVCHLQQKKRFVFEFKRPKDGTPEADMAIYHDNCIACHLETAGAGKKSGPVTGDCRSCHTAKPGAASSRQPIAFDKSLHYRHASAESIPPAKMYDDVNCSACHHIYDESAQKTLYKKGTEESCLYCHKSVKSDTASSIRTASHAACVSCHQSFNSRSEKTGPVACAGCHDAVEQKKIKVVDTTPRLKRNQPDTVLLASWMAAGDGSESTMKKHMDPVAFNHLIHESKTANCRSCHHETLKRCGECHTGTGNEKGGDVQLAQAMHNAKSSRSCVGCHNQAKIERDCAGCHASRPQKRFSQIACASCHAVDRAFLGPFPMQEDAVTTVAENVLKSHAGASAALADDQIPEKVKINAMVNTFEAVDFPHRQMVRALSSRIKENKMAAYFHSDDITLCVGCHHNSPATLNPPKCASCHGQAFKNEQDGRPGLKGAYHGQCIACHQVMGIEEPAATDCIKCHKERS